MQYHWHITNWQVFCLNTLKIPSFSSVIVATFSSVLNVFCSKEAALASPLFCLPHTIEEGRGFR